MMHHRTSKKILVYFFLLILLGTLNNKNLNKLNFPKIKEIKVSGLDESDNQKLSKKFNFLKIQNLFFLDKNKIINIIDSNNLIENYIIYKIYPSSLKIEIQKTEFLANVNKDGINYSIGSNGKLINIIDENKEIPFIYGNFANFEFLELKKTIDISSFDFKNIRNLFYFPSGRWDIETYSGVLIKLSKERLEESLNLSLSIISDSKFENVKIIDLRQHNQVIIDG